MAMMRNAASFLAAAFLIITMAKATKHMVGDTEGWTTGVDYEAWASNNSLVVGDILVFEYIAGYHSVLLVSKEDYNSCTSTSPIESDDSGLTNVGPLTEEIYHIISGMGDCENGMKLKIDTSGNSGSGDSQPPPASKSPSPPTSKSKSPPSETSQPPPAGSTWKLNSAHKFSSTGSFALTFALMILAAF